MASTPIDIPVLIVGAGPAGLVLALTLAKNNIPVRVIEKNTTFHSSQRGSGIQPRSLELFKFLGVLPDMWAGSRYNTPSAIYKMPEGREIAKIVDMTPYVEPTPDVPFRTPRIIGQFHTEEILRSHLAQYNVIVETGSELVSFTQDEEGVTAEILLKTGDTQEKQTIRAQYLVSAEGAKSIVRKQLGIPFQGETKDVMHLVLADVHVTGVSADYWHQWGDMGTKTVRIRPTEDPGVFSIMAGGKDADVAALAASREALFAFVYEVTKRSPNELQFGEIRSLSEFRPNIRLADKYSEGRVFLVGDAVHVHSPTGGQGLNTGIQDSFNLGWKLSLVLKYQAPPSLLTTYNTERRPVARDVLSMTSEIMNKTVAFKTGEEATFARRPQALHQLGVNYRLSDIVVDEQPALNDDQIFSAAYKPEDATVLRAGDRAPDAPGLLRIEAKGTNVFGLVGESITLFDVFKPTRHTALVFLGGSNNLAVIQETVKALKSAPQGALHVLFVLPKDYEATLNALTSVVRDRDCGAEDTEIVVDTQGYAHTFYPPATQGFPVIIVRPDAAVGAVVKGGEGVSRYFKLVFGTERWHTV